MRLLLDMNLSPDLRRPLADAGHDVIHWSSVGDARASDREVMAYASEQRLIVVSHDLDFSAILAATHARGPSVVQIRAQDVSAPKYLNLLIKAVRQFEAELSDGALVVVDESRSRIRVLPIE